MTNTIRILLVEPMEKPKLVNIEHSLKSLQKLVGGNIEMTYPFEDEYLAVISNEESKLLDLPPNRAIRRADGSVIDIYCGTMVVVALAPEGEYRDLTNKEAKTVMKMWGVPEDKDDWGGAKPNTTIRVFASPEAIEMMGGAFA